jgi:hypothetical protein
VCVYDCEDKYNCFVGRGGTNWFDAMMQWSKHSFPTWPQVARVGATVKLNDRARGAAKGIIVTKNGKVSIRANGGNLQIGQTTCDAAEYQTGAPTAIDNRECTAHTTCTDGQFAAMVAGTHHDRICQNHVVCATEQYEIQAATAHQDRKCMANTVCSSTQYEAVAPTAISDRNCAEIYTCSADEFESIAPTATSDRICVALTVCTAQEYLTVSATLTSDRACAETRVCAAGEFMVADATAITNRVCKTHTSCTNAQFEAKAGAAHSDRVCHDCAACPVGRERQHCGGTQPGWCLPTTCGNSDTTCWVGAPGQRWQGLVTSWSKSALPTSAWNVIVAAGAPQITSPRAAAMKVTIQSGSVVALKVGGMLTLG